MAAEVASALAAAAEGAPVEVTTPAVFSFSRSASAAEAAGLATNAMNKKSVFATLKVGSRVLRAGRKSRVIRVDRPVVSVNSVFTTGCANQASGVAAFMPGTFSR